MDNTDMDAKLNGNKIQLPIGTEIWFTDNGHRKQKVFDNENIKLIDSEQSLKFYALFDQNDVDFKIVIDNKKCGYGIGYTLTINEGYYDYYVGPRESWTMEALYSKGRKLHFISQSTEEGKLIVAETADKHNMSYSEASAVCSRIEFNFEVEKSTKMEKLSNRFGNDMNSVMSSRKNPTIFPNDRRPISSLNSPKHPFNFPIDSLPTGSSSYRGGCSQKSNFKGPPLSGMGNRVETHGGQYSQSNAMKASILGTQRKPMRGDINQSEQSSTDLPQWRNMSESSSVQTYGLPTHRRKKSGSTGIKMGAIDRPLESIGKAKLAKPLMGKKQDIFETSDVSNVSSEELDGFFRGSGRSCELSNICGESPLMNIGHRSEPLNTPLVPEHNVGSLGLENVSLSQNEANKSEEALQPTNNESKQLQENLDTNRSKRLFDNKDDEHDDDLGDSDSVAQPGDRGVICFGEQSAQVYQTYRGFAKDMNFVIKPFIVEMRMSSTVNPV